MKSYGKQIKVALSVFQVRVYEVLALLPPKTYEGKLYAQTVFGQILTGFELNCNEKGWCFLMLVLHGIFPLKPSKL